MIVILCQYLVTFLLCLLWYRIKVSVFSVSLPDGAGVLFWLTSAPWFDWRLLLGLVYSRGLWLHHYFVSGPTTNCPTSPSSHTAWPYSNDMGIDRGHDSSTRSKHNDNDSGVGVSATERRFAYSLLEKLLEYLEKASVNMQMTRPSTRFSRRQSYSTATEDVKFFGKVGNFYTTW